MVAWAPVRTVEVRLQEPSARTMAVRPLTARDPLRLTTSPAGTSSVTRPVTVRLFPCTTAKQVVVGAALARVRVTGWELWTPSPATAVVSPGEGTLKTPLKFPDASQVTYWLAAPEKSTTHPPGFSSLTVPEIWNFCPATWTAVIEVMTGGLFVPPSSPWTVSPAHASTSATGSPARTFQEAIDMDGTHVRIAILRRVPSRKHRCPGRRVVSLGGGTCV